MSRKADDGFELYFAEKLWEMIPAVYREKDAEGDNPGVLRSLVEVIAGQAATLRKDTDRLWDDQFIELCEDWAVPYIADLVGTRLLSDKNRRGRRVDVAKTIYYRRRKGTLRVLEQLIRDIAGWDGKVVENFKRLARLRHGLDPEPGMTGGRLTGTPPGGTADLRSPHGSSLAHGPFDEFYHLADVRKYKGMDGRYAIPKLAFHLYPLMVNPVVDSTPFEIKTGESYTFDPSGRSIPLFMPDYRPHGFDWDEWHSALEWELPSAIPCRLLGHAEYMLGASKIQELKNTSVISASAAKDLLTIAGLRFRNETEFVRFLLSMPNAAELTSVAVYRQLLAAALADDCGKSVLLENAVKVLNAGIPVPPESIKAGYLPTSLPLPDFKGVIIDPANGLFSFKNLSPAGEVAVTYHYGFPGKIGAGTYDRPEVEESADPDVTLSGGGTFAVSAISSDGITRIEDNQTYYTSGNRTNIRKMTLFARNGKRPFISLNGDLSFKGKDETSELIMDGIWIGSSLPCNFIINGPFRCVILKNCTLDPGDQMDPFSPVPLIINSSVEFLVIDSCITGPIITGPKGHIENIIIRDSIVQSVNKKVTYAPTKETAILLNDGMLNMERVTVFGELIAHRLRASETLITGLATVTDTQNGCFRFSAGIENSRLPKRYESHLFPSDTGYWFISGKFGQPWYGAFSESAPAVLKTGSEDGSEIGAYCNLLNPVKMESLDKKAGEYMPFGLIPLYIKET
ncbi:MAG: hypothetical protein NTU98_00170 [Bacteroidetes bacterium]|nr:hypothetical protein [Bacteroidota bacterium]